MRALPPRRTAVGGRIDIISSGTGEVAEVGFAKARITESLHTRNGDPLGESRERDLTLAGRFVVTNQTREIPQRLGTIFGTIYGVRFVLVGSPERSRVALKTVMRTRHIIHDSAGGSQIIERLNKQEELTPIGIERGICGMIHEGIINTHHRFEYRPGAMDWSTEIRSRGISCPSRAGIREMTGYSRRLSDAASQRYAIRSAIVAAPERQRLDYFQSITGLGK